MIKRIIIFLFFFSVLLLYIHNLTRDVYSGDIGDLVTASYVLGVPHPPGYPLFTFLGFLFSQLPLSLAPVSKVALVSTLSSFLGLILFYKLFFRITKSLFISLLSTSILAFSYPYWLHAELPEAFGLNNLFVILLLYFGILFYQEQKEKQLYMLIFLMGLSLTHHHTILLIFPGIALLLLRRIKIIFSKKRIPILCLLFFTIGLTPYIYVPIAASFDPLINWDHAYNLQNFIHLILRKDYGGFAPSIVNAIPIAAKQAVVQNYIKTLLLTYSYQVLFLVLLGCLYLIKRNKFLLGAILGIFFLSGPLFIFYASSLYTTKVSLGIIERFFTISFIVLMFLVPFGLLLIKNITERFLKYKPFSLVILAYFLIIPYFMLKYNLPRTDLSQTQIGNNFAIDVLSYVPENSVLYVSGDTTAFNIWYVHYVLKKRPDIGLINPAGVGGNRFLDEEINEFHKKYPEIKLSDILDKTLEELRTKRAFYATYEAPYKPKGLIWVPKGLVYELKSIKDISTKNEYREDVEQHLERLQRPRLETLSPSEQNLVTPEIPLIYSNALVRIGDFIDLYYKDPVLAEHYYRRALWMDNENPAAYAGLAFALYKGSKDCNGSIANLKRAIENYPIWKLYYAQLYLLYHECKYSNTEINNFKNQYLNTYGNDIDIDLPISIKNRINTLIN